MSKSDRDDGLFSVLFLCTGNSARSLLAEAILSRLGASRFSVESAGSHPKDAPHPMTIETLDRLGYETSTLRSKSWDEFAGPDHPSFDLIVTVCDDAAGEACPIWPGQPLVVHWGVPDPAACEGSPDEVEAFFEQIHDQLAAKIAEFVRLDPASLSAEELASRCEAIGRR